MIATYLGRLSLISAIGAFGILLMTSCDLNLKTDNAYKSVSSTDSNASMQVHTYKLDNGLTVYISPNHEEPRFYAEIITRAGSKHDPNTNTGLAHYLEHLLFKGTSNFGTIDYENEKPLLDRITQLYEDRSKETNSTRRQEIYSEINKISQEAAALAVPNEMDRVYGDMGAKGVNAHTWHEETVYKIDLPSNRLKHWAKIEAERFANPVFRLFHTELETVYEEKNRSIDNKDRLISREVNALLFKNHPYGQQSTLGSVEHLKNPSILAIKEYFDKYYVPDNMAICISGDVDPKEAMSVISRAFSSWQPGKTPIEILKWNEKSLEGREFVEVKYQGEEQVTLAFRTVDRNHDDFPAVRLVDMILDNSVAGLINLNLVEAQVVRAAGAYPQNMNDYGVQYLVGVPKDGQTLDQVEALLKEQIDKVKRGEFEDWILPAVLNDFKKRRKQDLEENDRRVELLRDTFLSFNDWNDTANEINKLEQVTKEDVVTVANKYFGENYVVGHRIDAQHDLPQIEKPKIDPLEIEPGPSSAFMQEIDEMDIAAFAPKYLEANKDYETRDIRPGLTLYHATNPVNDLFVVNFRIETGSRQNAYLPYAKRLLDRSGAGDLSSEQLKIEWYKLGSEFNLSVSERFTDISLSGLDEQLAPSLDLAHKHLSTPKVDDETLTKLVEILLAERDDESKDPRILAHALAHFHRYGDRSRFRNRPTNADLNATSVPQLKETLSKLLNYEQSILYIGPRSADEIADALSKKFPLPENLATPPPYEAPRSHKAERNQIYFYEKEMAQAQVRLEFSVGERNETKLPAAQLYNEYFAGGMAGLVFQELREARALAYSAWGNYFAASRPDEENILVGAIGCQADKTIEAVIAFLELLEDMPLNEKRWDSAQEALESAYRTNPARFRQIPGAVYDWTQLGLKEDPRKTRFQVIESATIETLKEFYEREIQPRQKLISIVGDSTKIDLQALEKIGPVTKVSKDDLFTY
jgi:predicted Zn-dependent peptidase